MYLQPIFKRGKMNFCGTINDVIMLDKLGEALKSIEDDMIKVSFLAKNIDTEEHVLFSIALHGTPTHKSDFMLVVDVGNEHVLIQSGDKFEYKGSEYMVISAVGKQKCVTPNYLDLQDWIVEIGELQWKIDAENGKMIKL